MLSNIVYEGKVSIKVKNKPPVRTHNKGTPQLFNMLCNMLSTTLNSSTTTLLSKTLPCYMTIIKSVDNIEQKLTTNISYKDYSNLTIVQKPVLITSRNVINKGQQILFTTLIPRSQLLTVSEELKSDKCYALLLDGSYRILAYADFESADLDAVYEDPYGQAALEWEMSFSNIKTVQEETING